MPPAAVALGLTLWQLAYMPRAQEETRTADVERHHRPVTGLEPLHRRPDLVDHADELVTERHADPGCPASSRDRGAGPSRRWRRGSPVRSRRWDVRSTAGPSPPPGR